MQVDIRGQLCGTASLLPLPMGFGDWIQLARLGPQVLSVHRATSPALVIFDLDFEGFGRRLPNRRKGEEPQEQRPDAPCQETSDRLEARCCR